MLLDVTSFFMVYSINLTVKEISLVVRGILTIIGGYFKSYLNKCGSLSMQSFFLPVI